MKYSADIYFRDKMAVEIKDLIEIRYTAGNGEKVLKGSFESFRHNPARNYSFVSVDSITSVNGADVLYTQIFKQDI